MTWELAGTGAVIAVGGAALFAVKGVVADATRMAARQCCVTLTVRDDAAPFFWVRSWLTTKIGRPRTVLGTVLPSQRAADGPPGATDRADRFALVPAPGSYCFRYGRTLAWAHYEREKPSGTQPASETITITFWTRDTAVPQAVLREALAGYDESGTVPVTLVGNYGNMTTSRLPTRSLSTVALPAGMREKLLADARRYFADREWYARRGQPYRRGWLFFGPPGTGKTTAAFALASDLGAPVFTVALTALSDGNLAAAMQRIPPSSVVVYEDCDCVTAMGRRPTDEAAKAQPNDAGRGELSLGGVLNAIDGLVATTGSLLILTTNHPDRLDPALLRPGRVDRQWEFALADADQGAELYTLFFPHHAELAAGFGAAVGAARPSPAAVQEHLLRHRDDPVAAARWVEAA